LVFHIGPSISSSIVIPNLTKREREARVGVSKYDAFYSKISRQNLVSIIITSWAFRQQSQAK
jgi:hypothetical protein